MLVLSLLFSLTFAGINCGNYRDPTMCNSKRSLGCRWSGETCTKRDEKAHQEAMKTNVCLKYETDRNGCCLKTKSHCFWSTDGTGSCEEMKSKSQEMVSSACPNMDCLGVLWGWDMYLVSETNYPELLKDYTSLWANYGEPAVPNVIPLSGRGSPTNEDILRCRAENKAGTKKYIVNQPKYFGNGPGMEKDIWLHKRFTEKNVPHFARIALDGIVGEHNSWAYDAPKGDQLEVWKERMSKEPQEKRCTFYKKLLNTLKDVWNAGVVHGHPGSREIFYDKPSDSFSFGFLETGGFPKIHKELVAGIENDYIVFYEKAGGSLCSELEALVKVEGENAQVHFGQRDNRTPLKIHEMAEEIAHNALRPGGPSISDADERLATRGAHPDATKYPGTDYVQDFTCPECEEGLKSQLTVLKKRNFNSRSICLWQVQTDKCKGGVDTVKAPKFVDRTPGDTSDQFLQDKRKPLPTPQQQQLQQQEEVAVQLTESSSATSPLWVKGTAFVGGMLFFHLILNLSCCTRKQFVEESEPMIPNYHSADP